MEDMDDFKSVVFETERQKQEARKEHKWVCLININTDINLIQLPSE
jgi:hypothetical protein